MSAITDLIAAAAQRHGVDPRTLAPFAAGGRHPAAALVTAGGWRDEPALREALAGGGGKLAAIGLRLDRRKAGIRMAMAA